MDTAAPVIHSATIRPEWLDYNDHLNVAYYVLIFDQAGEALVNSLGMGEAVTRATGISWVVLENHVTYDQEVTLGQTVDVTMQVVDYDHKRLHLYWEMHVSGEDGYLAATLEQMVMCVDLNRRRSTSFPPEVQAQIDALAKAHAKLPTPVNIGRRIGIRR